MSSAKVRLGGDLSTAAAAQPGGTAASCPFGCRPLVSAARCLTSRLLPWHMVLVAKSSRHQLGEEKWDPWLPRVLISVLCVCLLTAPTCCCGFQKFLVLNTRSLSEKDLHMSSTPGERRSRARHISVGCVHHQLLGAPEPPALGTGDAGRERLRSWAK